MNFIFSKTNIKSYFYNGDKNSTKTIKLNCNKNIDIQYLLKTINLFNNIILNLIINSQHSH